MHESSHDDCGCCADAHFGALLNQTSRLIRRALDARINAEVSSELSGVRGPCRAPGPRRLPARH